MEVGNSRSLWETAFPGREEVWIAMPRRRQNEERRGWRGLRATSLGPQKLLDQETSLGLFRVLVEIPTHPSYLKVSLC